MNHLKYVVLLTFVISFVGAADKATQKILTTYSTTYQKVLDKAQKDIDKAKSKALKALAKELKKAKRKDLTLVAEIEAQIASLDSQPSLASMVKSGSAGEGGDSFFTDIETPEEKKKKLEVKKVKVEFNFSDCYGGILGTMHNKDRRYFKSYPKAKEWVGKHKMDENGALRIKFFFDKLKKHLQENNFTFNSDKFLEENYPELFEAGIRASTFQSYGMKINSIIIENRQLNPSFDKRDFFGIEIKVENQIIDFWALYQEAKAKLEQKKK